jgi:hypothetical protein
VLTRAYVQQGDEQVEIKSQWLDGDLSIKLVAVGDDCNRLKTKLLFTYTDRYPEDYVPTVFENHVGTVAGHDHTHARASLQCVCGAGSILTYFSLCSNTQ